MSEARLYFEEGNRLNEAPTAAVLIDVGGTLWPGDPPALTGDNEARVNRLYAAIPMLKPPLGERLCDQLMGRPAETKDSLIHDIHSFIREVANSLGMSLVEREIAAVRQAMSLPVYGRLEPFAGALELLVTGKELALRCSIVTNTKLRNARDYRRDVEDLALSEHIDGIVTSLDVGYLKPHLEMFEAARSLAGCCASRYVFIGDSERNDVLPAVSLGMRVIRAAIEEPPPANSAADAPVTSLTEATEILRRWAAGNG